MSFSFFQITRRYAEFSAAIVSLNESFPDEKVRIVKFNSLTVISFLILFCTLGEKFPVAISSIHHFFFQGKQSPCSFTSRGRELHFAYGRRVSFKERTAYFPNQQLRYDAGCFTGMFYTRTPDLNYYE